MTGLTTNVLYLIDTSCGISCGVIRYVRWDLTYKSIICLAQMRSCFYVIDIINDIIVIVFV